MAETKLPLLRDALTLPERVMLASLTRHVGFPVLVKLFEAVCERAMQDVAKADPESDRYEKILAVRQQRSRTSFEVMRDVLDSIKYHQEIASHAGAPEDLLDSQLQLEGE